MDSNTIAEHVLVITEEEHEELEELTEKLDKETTKAEQMINKNQKLAKPLSLPGEIRKVLKKMVNYQVNRHIRLMRYDFHPTTEGKWALSEVNSDVPGGFAEASIMPKIAVGLFESERYKFKNFGEVLTSCIVGKVKSGKKIMLVHCTSYSDDRQVMQFLGDKLQDIGYTAIYAAADHLRFDNNKAISLLDGNTGKIDAIIRFTPIEWLVKMKDVAMWRGYFDTTTVSCNHPIAVYAQTKRFPLAWDLLEKQGADLTVWREHLPETLEVKAARNKAGFINKPVYGRTGENISIKEACSNEEYEKTIKDVKRNPKKYLAQKRFDSKPVQSENGEEYHVCLGAFTVDGKAAGYYARVSKTPRIDSNAADIPVLIEKSGKIVKIIKNEDNKETKESNENKSIENNENIKRSTQSESTHTTADSEQQPSKNPCREAYKAWAPANSIWSKWVRPVPFVTPSLRSFAYKAPRQSQTPCRNDVIYPAEHLHTAIDSATNAFSPLRRMKYTQNNEAGSTPHLENISPDTAIILDIPSCTGIVEGVTLAHIGWRPIPLYNGTTEQHGAIALVDNNDIKNALLYFADAMKELDIKKDAPPVFLLDSNRMHRCKVNVSVFDNSWDVYPQDMPSGEFLLNNGIKRIVLCGHKIHCDIHKILYTYQSKGITILYTNGIEFPNEITLKKPPKEVKS